MNIKSVIAALALMVIIGSCHNEDPLEIDNKIPEANSSRNGGVVSMGDCVVDMAWDGEIMSANSQQVFSILPYAGATDYTWYAESPLSIVSGQGTNSVTVDAGCPSSLTTAELSVVAEIGLSSSCYQDGMITITAGECTPTCPDPTNPECPCPNPSNPLCEPPCTCPSPVITVTNCEQTNGYLLATVSGVQSGDIILWEEAPLSQGGFNNVRSIHGQTSQNVAIDFFNDGDFKIHCTITRPCGTSRTAWYASSQGTNCQYYGSASYNCSTSGGGGLLLP